MADDLGLYWSLFQGQFPEEWKNDPDFAHYLVELSSFSVEKLQFEPEHLREERRCVLNSTQKLAFTNYQTFIETATCTREVFKDFVAVEDHVSKLLEKIPGFTAACKTFAKESQEINSKRKLNSLALSKHTQLLEILEIPQVMETCVRNGYYEQALDLNTHVKRMHKKHGEIPIIKDIAEDVQCSMDLMLNQLLQQLRTSIQLPACLKVVGLLRRMDVFTGTELRLKFLQTRDTWLQSVLSAIPGEDPYHHITKTIETSRVHLFDIVTQYRAIFPDDDPVKLSYSSSVSGAGGVGGALFYTWVNEKIWQFLRVLEEDLHRGVGGRIDSLLGQCMYFGLSFSRIGADFRSLITPVFVRVLVNSFHHTVRNAKHHFHESMKHLTLSAPLRSLTTLPPHSTLSTQSPSPPHTLLDFPPLAVLTNSLIHAFNELRQCAPLALGPEVAQELRRLLESTVHDIVEYHRLEHGSFTDKERKAFQQLVRVVLRDFLPYVERIFENLFSEGAVEQLAVTTPYVLGHCKTNSDSGAVLPATRRGVELRMKLDIKSIGEPLKKVAPDVYEDLEALKRQLQFASLHHGDGDGVSELATTEEKKDGLSSAEQDTGVQSNAVSVTGSDHLQPSNKNLEEADVGTDIGENETSGE